MNFYLVAYDLQKHDEDFEKMFHLLNSKGKAVQVQKNAVILASELTTQEIHDSIHDCAESYDWWVITKLDKEFTGRSEKVDLLNRFLRSHSF
ncbi:hypothetical protein M5X00_32055 [Paenibacillus alvei]|uniref:Uncharacterized protein n=1 Tax=Paenibacillus alvei TaxID=44250 RepID=A0ABT4GWW7_PAEAL|nr:hypothetical protein [Paenibacillus alvei]MCY9541815.1 hypothetical protein [Paenibacillus alvei]MCY9704997.1 hypothetical protein [Paenibacillus alvei]MCY9734674.1 hypothetical protein [Paenibacillus alvei]MCY9758852.1 hypothetical protein [Paenibacillus alvei]MCY9761201.1 hypothetical protein [Paenibacillus alvei]